MLRETRPVPAHAPHIFCVIGLVRPEQNFCFLSESNGQRRSESTSTKYGDTHALAPFFPPPSMAGLDWSKGQRGRADRVMSSGARVVICSIAA